MCIRLLLASGYWLDCLRDFYARVSGMSDDRKFYVVRVYLAQVRHFRMNGHTAFAHTLLNWAGNARRREMAPEQIAEAVGQMDMFA